MAAVDDGKLPAGDVAAEAAPCRNRGSGIEGSIVAILVPVASFHVWNFRFRFGSMILICLGKRAAQNRNSCSPMVSELDRGCSGSPDHPY
jgi:hypothetical protein